MGGGKRVGLSVRHRRGQQGPSLLSERGQCPGSCCALGNALGLPRQETPPQHSAPLIAPFSAAAVTLREVRLGDGSPSSREMSRLPGARQLHQCCHTATKQETLTPPPARQELLRARCWERGADGRTRGGHDSSPLSWESSSIYTASARLATSVKSEGSCETVELSNLKGLFQPRSFCDSSGQSGSGRRCFRGRESHTPGNRRGGGSLSLLCPAASPQHYVPLGRPQLPPAMGF